jgi:hypothetical protein
VVLALAIWLIPAAAPAPNLRSPNGLVSSAAARTLHQVNAWLDNALGTSDERRSRAASDDTLEDAQDSRDGNTPGLSPDQHAVSKVDAPSDLRRAETRQPPEPVATRLISSPRDLAAPRPPPTV